MLLGSVCYPRIPVDIAILSACLFMVTVGIFSLLVPGGRQPRYDITGTVYGAGGGGCAVVLLSPGAVFVTVRCIQDLGPVCVLAFVATGIPGAVLEARKAHPLLRTDGGES